VVSLGIFSEAYDGTMRPGVDSASKNEYQDTPGSKAGRCVRLTTYHLHVPNVKKIRGLNLPDPHGPVQACSGTALHFKECLEQMNNERSINRKNMSPPKTHTRAYPISNSQANLPTDIKKIYPITLINLDWPYVVFYVSIHFIHYTGVF
jgi:hypothetical protein